MTSPRSQAEIERKYETAGGEVEVAAVDAALRALARPGTLSDPEAIALDATYYDTEDLALLRHRITMRRRTGGDDAGWHVKLPVSDDERRELRLPLGTPDEPPPSELTDLVRAYARGRSLEPVAVLHTTRIERHVLGPDDEDRAVITDDHVRSWRTPDRDGAERAWTEVEVELVDGKRRLLDAIEQALLGAGLRPSCWPSKLARALDRPDAGTSAEGRDGAARKATTGEVLVGYVREQVALLLACDAPVRADEPDAVHDMRVATRRLRSQLATFRPVLTRERSDPVRDELRWLGVALGGARDAEVQLERVLGTLDELAEDLVVGPVRERVEAELSARHAKAHAEVVLALDSDRYRRLLDTLDGLVDEPPLNDDASKRARSAVPHLVDRAARRVDRAARRADAADTTELHGAAIHDVRKAAKRARYAAESAGPVSGRQAERLAERFEALQDVLGEHQDAVSMQALLPELAATATAAGESAFTYGVLHAIDFDRRRSARRDYPSALRATQRAKVRDWCS